jgi:hypothetical protein
MTKHLDKLGSTGAVIAAAACPICFPKLALLGGLIGLSAISAYEAQLFIAAQLLVVVAVTASAAPGYASLGDHLPEVRRAASRNHAARRLRVFLRMPRLRHRTAAAS